MNLGTEMVSIILPAYNASRYIAESIASIQRQTYDNWELIVVDDGSDDDTSAVVTGLKDSRIRLIRHQHNAGVSAARNTGMLAAKGQYLTFLDADDYWHVDFLKNMIGKIETSGRDVAYCGYAEVDNSGTILRPYPYIYLEGAILIPYITKKTWLTMCSFVVRKSLIDRFGIRFQTGCRMGEDQEFVIKMLSVGEVAAENREMFFYRQHPSSVTKKTWDWRVYIEAIEAIDRARLFIAENNVVDKQLALEALDRKAAFETLDILGNMMTLGFYDELSNILACGWGQRLTKIKVSTLSPAYMLKYVAVVSDNRFLWALLSLLRKIRYAFSMG